MPKPSQRSFVLLAVMPFYIHAPKFYAGEIGVLLVVLGAVPCVLKVIAIVRLAAPPVDNDVMVKTMI